MLSFLGENWAAAIFGFAGIVCSVVIYQCKTRRSLLAAKLASDVIWFMYYFLLGAYSGAAVAAIGMAREVVFINRKKKWAAHPAWLALFILLSIAAAIYTWKNAFSLLTMAASILSIIGFWVGKPALSRVLAFPISGAMLTYDIVCGQALAL